MSSLSCFAELHRLRLVSRPCRFQMQRTPVGETTIPLFFNASLARCCPCRGCSRAYANTAFSMAAETLFLIFARTVRLLLQLPEFSDSNKRSSWKCPSAGTPRRYSPVVPPNQTPASCVAYYLLYRWSYAFLLLIVFMDSSYTVRQ